MFKRRTITAAMALVACAWPLAPAVAADYPSKSIRIVVGYPPGGTTDLLGRLVGTRLQESLKQPAIVENKAGAGGNIGMDTVVKAAPDGYTLGLGTAGNLALNYLSYASMPYDSLKDLSPVSLLATVPNVIVVNSSVPATSVAELVEYIRKKNGGFFASTGAGNGPHLTGEMFKLRTGLNLTHVPYQGSAPAMTAVLGGRDVDMLFDNLPSVLPFIQSGKVRAIAVSSAQRVPALPNVPTLQEQGMNDFVVDAWFALVAPAALDPAARDRLAQAVAGLNADEGFKDSIRKLGAIPQLTGGPELHKLIAQERQRWPALARQLNLKF